MKFVTRRMSYSMRSIRPESGRIGHWMANRNFSISPRKKIGMLMPISDRTEPAESDQVPCRLAVYMPSGMPMPMAKVMRRQRELDGGREALEEVVGDVAVGDEAVPQVEPDDAGDVGEVLLDQGLVQAHCLAHALERLRRGALAQDGARRIAGQRSDEQEDAAASARAGSGTAAAGAEG